MEHQEPGPGQQLARQINRRGWNLVANGIATQIHSVAGHIGISVNKDAHNQANLPRDAR